MRSLLFAAVAVTLMVAACGSDDLPDELTITDARIGEPVGPNAALYFTVENPGSDTAIVAVETSAGRQTALHDHVVKDGVLVMEEIDGAIDVPAGGRTVLEPGGTHIMLIESADLAVGDTVPVTVVMADGTTLDVVAEVVGLDELLDG